MSPHIADTEPMLRWEASRLVLVSNKALLHSRSDVLHLDDGVHGFFQGGLMVLLPQRLGQQLAYQVLPLSRIHKTSNLRLETDLRHGLQNSGFDVRLVWLLSVGLGSIDIRVNNDIMRLPQIGVNPHTNRPLLDGT